MADFNFIIGADDAEFRAAMQRTEGAASKSMGRIGSVVEARTAGFRKLAGSVSSVAGVFTSMVGVVALVGGAVYGLANAFDVFGTRAAERAREVRDAMQGINDQIFDIELSLGRRSDEDRLRKQLERDLREIEKVQDKLAATAFDKGPIPGVPGLGFFDPGFYEQIDQLNEIDRKEQKRRELLEAQLEALNDQRDARIEDIKNQTILLGLSQEETALANTIARIDKVAAEARADGLDQEVSRLQEIRQMRIQEHEQKMAQIAEEAQARRDADRQAMENRQRQSELNAKMLQMQFELDLARATGNEDQATAIQKRIDLERRYQQITSMEGLSISQMLGLLRLSRQIAEASSVENVASGFSASSPSAMAGLSLTPTLFNQVFGGQSAAKNMDRERNSTLKSMDGSLRVIAKNTGRPAGAVYG